MRANVRVEFLCGGRAIRRARADYDALAQIARVFSSALDDTPALVAAQAEQVKEAEKQRRKLAVEAAQRRGRELYEAAPLSASGVRRHIERIASGGFDDELRALAQGYTAQADGVFIAACDDPPSVLFAVSAGSAIRAGDRLKQVLSTHGGKGGGNPQLAQGSFPTQAALAAALDDLTSA